MNRTVMIVVFSLTVGAVGTALTSIYNSSSYSAGLGNSGMWYGFPLGYSLYHTNELMGSRLFYYFSYENALLDFVFWTLIVCSALIVISSSTLNRIIVKATTWC